MYEKYDPNTTDLALLVDVFDVLTFVREHNYNGDSQCADCIDEVDRITDLLNQRIYGDEPGA